MKVTAAAVLAIAMLSACAGPPPAPTEPVARSDGSFTITRIGSHFYAAPADVTATAVKDAETHCQKSGKQFKSIGLKETPTRGGHGPQSDVTYRCD